ncbi:O-antigen ligase family protein [Pedobacter sp. MC2016-24]|nr:O-antigen ligase family protein [Pedobacter sp. MC2016-24]
MNKLSERLSSVNPKIMVVFFVIFLTLMASVLAFLTTLMGVKGAIFFLAVTGGPVLIYFIVRYPKFGVILYLIMAYLLMYVLGFGIDFPLGTLMDATLVLLLIGFLLKQKFEPNWEIFKNATTTIILIWIFYNVLMVINPAAESRLAWVYTIRSVAGVMLSYFIFNYQIKTVAFIRLIIKFWLTLSVFAALYAIKQEYFGFFAYEERALNNDPMLQALLYIDGHWRKSSIFSDPVAFSYNMVASGIFCICMLFGPSSRNLKILFSLMALLFFFVMLFSGTRAAYVLLPAAMGLLFILKFNLRVLIFTGIFAVFMIGLINVPTSNSNLARFQTAFRPNNDASYNVRVENQKKIQPFIRSHPIGGGLGSTGVWGVRFAPYSFLAQFPPDSGYVRVAVELGWVGLFLICCLMFIVLKTGINNYFKIKDPELKTYCLAMVLMIFAINIGNFPQEAIVQFPLNVFFYLFIALINVTYRLDQEKQVSSPEV